MRGSVFIISQSIDKSLHPPALKLKLPYSMQELATTLETKYKQKFKERKIEVSPMLGRVYL